jgi:hypothetical protein
MNQKDIIINQQERKEQREEDKTMVKIHWLKRIYLTLEDQLSKNKMKVLLIIMKMFHLRLL